jgi:hypothetical protein
MPDGRDPRSPIRGTDSRLRTLVHGAIALAAWGVFVWAWYIVFYKRTAQQTLQGLMVLGVFLAGMNVITLIWVWHNLRLYRRKGPRRAVPVVREDWSADFFGRRISSEWAAIREADIVDVTVTEVDKVYSIVRQELN